MSTPRPTLYGSSGTIEGIGNVIADFYGGERKTLAEGPDLVWTVRRASGVPIEGVRVVLIRGRYRFENVGVR